jgi:hypothetical protein
MAVAPEAKAQATGEAVVVPSMPRSNGGYYLAPGYRYPYGPVSSYMPAPAYYPTYYSPWRWNEGRWAAWRMWDVMHGYRR